MIFERSRPGISRVAVRAFARRLRAEVAQGRDFCCLIADDATLINLNRQFRRKDYPADVLSFPAPEPLEPGAASPLGDIAISIERASEQACRLGHSLESELEILMLHGLLHLMGMDHAADRGRMARAERRWRQELGLPAGLIERARA